ncbi:sugar phosphorylase [candidate division KSB1 bacterium]|nr:sugar phosphorylase [candidate division KSB1 bacterium]NIR71639.1 sugar phosphorylase [candidate division KSB1 bacterium]NIS23458.1 sugar phosphorylase [candidate division KSB1 bacterium]NIT70368.1 sugar phosphorylase [candidate division KSB1 bacterium]NIU24067.1 sugar phosphorylase [candidate division KSB1 bacterium]
MSNQPLKVSKKASVKSEDAGASDNEDVVDSGHPNAYEFHFLEPDYARPIYRLPLECKQKILKRLSELYGEETAQHCFGELERVLKVYYAHKSDEMIRWEKEFEPSQRLSERDVILITYGDLICSPNQCALATLARLSKQYLKGVFNTLHILPFFPYSSDRGFAVMDFEEVDPHLGTWNDILELKKHFKLMFDGVFNHVSSKSRWFQEYLNGNPAFKNFFTEFTTRDAISEDYLKIIVRPRTSDILTPFNTLNGPRLVWTTFGPDQIDLNYHNPNVLVKMVEILLTYVRRGADFIRLDAVTYLWEELGTTCVHLNQNHITIKLFRDILDAVALHVTLITETNVPHEDNIRYFGNGNDEAQMVYNFALPALVLHAFQTGQASRLTKWAASLEKISDTATYFNFLDSHDGIGVMAVQNILSKDEIDMMALRVVEHGGFISYRDNGDGTESPYELNITWYSALNREDADESIDFQVKRYLASRAIALVFMGVPGLYIHGLLGSKNDAEAVLEEKQTRSINRNRISYEDLVQRLHSRNSSTSLIFHGFVDMIKKRIKEKAFHPNASQDVLDLTPGIFSLVRTSTDGAETILALTNVTNKRQNVSLDTNKTGLDFETWRDILTNKCFMVKEPKLTLDLEPYEVLWLKAE